MKNKRLMYLIGGIMIFFIPTLITGDIQLNSSSLEPYYSVDYAIRAITYITAILVILKGLTDSGGE